MKDKKPLEPAYDSERIWHMVRRTQYPCTYNPRVSLCGHSECECKEYRRLLVAGCWSEGVPTGPDGMARAPEAAAKALTYDDGKAPLAQLPWAAIEGLAMVQEYGHRKYKDFNNYRRGMEVSRNVSCALRHIKEYMEGSDKDKESGRHPLEHALTRLAFVLQNLRDGTAVDDRYRAPQ